MTTNLMSATTMLESYHGHVAPLARGIVYGIAGYDIGIDDELVHYLSEYMLSELMATVADMPERLASRSENVLKWTVNPLAPLEYATVTGYRVMMLLKATDKAVYRAVKSTKAFKDHRERCAKILPRGMTL